MHIMETLRFWALTVHQWNWFEQRIALFQLVGFMANVHLHALNVYLDFNVQLIKSSPVQNDFEMDMCIGVSWSFHFKINIKKSPG